MAGVPGKAFEAKKFAKKRRDSFFEGNVLAKSAEKDLESDETLRGIGYAILALAQEIRESRTHAS